MKVEVRPSTIEDLIGWIGDLPPVRVRAYTGLIDGEVVAVGGIAYLPNGAALAFLNADDVVREKAKLSLCKTAKRIMAESRARGVTNINALQTVDIEAAERFLNHLGFRLVDQKSRLFVNEV